MLSWSSNTLAIWCKEPTHWKRPQCRERLRAGREGVDRGWDGWMASLIQWTWVWANSRRQWRTGKPGVLQSMGSQRVRHDLVTERQQQNFRYPPFSQLSRHISEKKNKWFSINGILCILLNNIRLIFDKLQIVKFIASIQIFTHYMRDYFLWEPSKIGNGSWKGLRDWKFYVLSGASRVAQQVEKLPASNTHFWCEYSV